MEERTNNVTTVDMSAITPSATMHAVSLLKCFDFRDNCIPLNCRGSWGWPTFSVSVELWFQDGAEVVRDRYHFAFSVGRAIQRNMKENVNKAGM